MSKRSRRRLAVARRLALRFGPGLLALLGLLHAQPGLAQTWTGGRGDPTLWQVIALDATGEPDFPYGREDVAGDGLATFSATEAASDLRSAYATAEATKLWLRAYLAGTAAPGQGLRAFIFIDSDARNNTGGPAQGMELDEALEDDPTSGGYERVVSVRGNGSVLGVYEWNASTRVWLELTDVRPPDLRAEAGLALDPLEVGTSRHGYVQVELAHALSGLNQSCSGTLFLRVLNDASAMRTFADDAPEEFACTPREDPAGVPVILQPDGCDSDAQCPADGRCQDGICLFAYACESEVDCPSGYSCSGGRCVRVVSGTCDSAGDCDGLVCDDARCVACTESGARACGGDLLCAPDGSCLNPDGSGGSGGGNLGPGKVRGGAFSCAASVKRAPAAPLSLLLAGLFLLRLRARRRARAERVERNQAATRRPQ
jgi:hypothetical protein